MFRLSHCCRLRRPESRVNKMGLLSKLLEPGDRQSVLHFDGLTLTRGAVVATPFAGAFSLTFRPVKCTDALASQKATRLKMLGRVVGSAYFAQVKKFLFVKLKSGSSCCSIITAAQMVNFSINNGRNVLKVKCKSKRFKRTNTNVNKSDKSQFKTNDTKY